jgi:hypothetical protein
MTCLYKTSGCLSKESEKNCGAHKHLTNRKMSGFGIGDLVRTRPLSGIGLTDGVSDIY